MKTLLTVALSLFAALPAAAGGGGFFNGGGGGGASSSSGTHIDGGNASFKNVTAETLTSTGTAPSLTATGGVIAAGSSFTVTGKSLFRGNVGLGTSVLDPDFAIDMGPDASTSKRWALYSDNAGGSFYGFGLHASGYVETWRNNDLVMSVGAGLVGIGSPSAGVAPNAALEVNRTGGDIFTATNAGATILAVHAGSSVTVTGNQTVTGNLGIGTASPAFKLHVSSGAQHIAGTGAKIVVGPTTQAAGADWNVNAANTLLVSNAGSVADVDKGYQVQVFYNGALAANEGGAIGFGGTYNGTSGLANWGGIKGYKQNATDGQVGGGLDFYTRLNSAGVSARKVRINPEGGLLPYSRTIAQLLAITPEVTGETYFCNNCSPLKLVVSTGTSAGNFADAIGGAFQ